MMPTPGKKKLQIRALNGLFSPVTGLPQEVVKMLSAIIQINTYSSQINSLGVPGVQQIFISRGFTHIS